MKKVFLSVLIFFSVIYAYAQSGNKYERFLHDNTFHIGWRRFTFKSDGQYSNIAPNDPTLGTYTVSGNKLTIEPYYCPDDPEKNYYYKMYLIDGITISLPATFEICPDDEDLFHKGCLIHESVTIWSECEEYSEGPFEYQGYKVKKYPVGSQEKYIFVLENTKMRDAPSLKSNVVELPYLPSHHNYDYLKKRHVVYAGEIIRIIGSTDYEETINGVKAKWYLIQEDDKMGDADSEYKLVWIFGGWIKEINRSELNSYKTKAEELLKKSEPGW